MRDLTPEPLDGEPPPPAPTLKNTPQTSGRRTPHRRLSLRPQAVSVEFLFHMRSRGEPLECVSSAVSRLDCVGVVTPLHDLATCFVHQQSGQKASIPPSVKLTD
ncbi:hypothetical protein COCON_G00126550 [Conger conger]|uniref:Uncharacterized protein n=1 Tax=Conger conger TaxID=82655 RepID=A0A9Q1DD36_CONCO|nr:hypothetical protein COCON_G00126550 [Conger conger]